MYAAIHRQQTPGSAVERAAAQPFAGHGTRYTELAYGAYGDVPQAGLINRKYPPGRAAHGTLRDLLLTFDCDYSNPVQRFSPAAVYVQLELLNDDPRGEDYRRWIFKDFVVRGWCERTSNGNYQWRVTMNMSTDEKFGTVSFGRANAWSRIGRN